MKVLCSLLLAVVSQLQTPGHLYLHMIAGYEVIVDGVSAGLTGDDVGGRIVDVVPGRHHVVVRSTDGREGAFDIAIGSGETSDVTLSPLGLRKKLSTDGEPGSLHVTCVPEDCNVTFREKGLTNDDTIETIPAGRYPLVATRGGVTVRSDVEIPAGTVVGLEVNFPTRSARVVETHRRAKRLTVAEANDALASLNVPAFWKSAIRSVLPAGVTVVGATIVDPNGIRASLRVPTEDVGWALIEGLVDSRSFSKITVPASPRKEVNSWVVDFTFYFPAPR